MRQAHERRLAVRHVLAEEEQIGADEMADLDAVRGTGERLQGLFGEHLPDGLAFRQTEGFVAGQTCLQEGGDLVSGLSAGIHAEDRHLRQMSAGRLLHRSAAGRENQTSRQQREQEIACHSHRSSVFIRRTLSGQPLARHREWFFAPRPRQRYGFSGGRPGVKRSSYKVSGPLARLVIFKTLTPALSRTAMGNWASRHSRDPSPGVL